MFEQFDNFLFSYEEYENAGEYKELPIRCKECGQVFYKRKKVINSIVTSQKRLQYLLYCSEHIDCARYVSVTCAWCGKQHQRLKSEVDKQIKDRQKRNNSTNHFFCDQYCARAYIKQNNIKRIRKSSSNKQNKQKDESCIVVRETIQPKSDCIEFKQYIDDHFNNVVYVQPNVYNIEDLYVVFHYNDEKQAFVADNAVHVYQWEWLTKQEKIVNLINTRLGRFNKRLYARQCVVEDIDHDTYKTFVIQHHLHGKAPNSDIRKGLFYKGELVSVISFGRGRFDESEYELIRYCVKTGYQIVGGFSKLVKNSGVDKFISYIDLAHFNGKGYIASGFKFISKTQPNYVYVKDGIVLSRYQAQKHKLSKLLGDQFDNSLSEAQNMINAGYTKIVDCGNMKVGYGL